MLRCAGAGQQRRCTQGRVELQSKGATFTSTYEHAFGPEVGQQAVCSTVAGIVDDALVGYNASVIAYGQTGTGKTHTMMGAREGALTVLARSAYRGHGLQCA